LLGAVDKVLICRGQTTVELAPGAARTDDLRGPTGGFRAPLLHVDDTLIVGFNREIADTVRGAR